MTYRKPVDTEASPPRECRVSADYGKVTEVTTYPKNGRGRKSFLGFRN